MKYQIAYLFAATNIFTIITAHGLLKSPPPRQAGPAMKAACGEQVYNNQASDAYGNIQGEQQVASSQKDYNAAECNLWQCKGFKLADNMANIQTWTAGQTVPFEFDLRAPHTGTANVSIVNTATNTIIGKPLVVYADFADNSKPETDADKSFQITVPTDLGDTCAKAGACVLQHYWNAASINQTYESCVDFTVTGSGSGSGLSLESGSESGSASTPSMGSGSGSEANPPSAPMPTTLQRVARPTPMPMAVAQAAPVTPSKQASAGAADNDDGDC